MFQPCLLSAWGGEASKAFFKKGIKAGYGGWGLDGGLCYLSLWERNLGRDSVAFLDTCVYNLYLDIIISPFAWMAA